MSVRELVAGGPVEMFANRLRTSRVRSVLRRPHAAAAATEVRAAAGLGGGQVVGVAPTELGRSRRARRVRGRLAGLAGPAARRVQTTL